MDKFKIRASQTAKIVSGNIGLTDKQEEEFQKLSGKDTLTAIQEHKLINMVDKINNPTLPEGLKTYCKNWLKNKIFNNRSSIYSKYMDKGNIMEDESIERSAELLNLGMVFKNEKFFEDDEIIGTPDVILSDEIIDLKNSWSEETFPYFEVEIPNKDYYWQLQSYMALTGKSKARLVYYLSDTPEHLIEKEAWFKIKELGFDDVSEEFLAVLTAKMTYSNVDPKKRIKVFEVSRNDKDIELIRERVKICRTYIKTLI